MNKQFLTKTKKWCLLPLLCIAIMSANAQNPIEFKLWPEGAPNTNGLTEEEAQARNIVYIAEPTLTVYLPETPNGLAVIACPGGGYDHLSLENEGHDMAPWYNAQGIVYAVLQYRMPGGHHDVPLSDAHQAIRIMKAHADEWGVKRLGIMGSSAGGHLASTAATHFTEDTRPDFQILFYPVILTDITKSHKGSVRNLLGEEPSEELLTLYSNDLQVTEQTPPAFIMHCTDDNAVPVVNSISYYLALLAHGVPVSMHIWDQGGHGWGFRDSFNYKPQWQDELSKWLVKQQSLIP